jgi:hypothetical protein
MLRLYSRPDPVLFERPDPVLFEQSNWTVWSVTMLEGLSSYIIVPATSLKSVVAIIPHNHHILIDRSDQRFFVLEKIGLDMGLLSRGNVDVKEDGEGDIY